MPVRMLIALAPLLLGVCAAGAMAQARPDVSEYVYIPSETTVAYVGEHYWLRTRLPDNWAYGLSPTEDGMQLMISQDPEAGGFSSDLITFTAKRPLADWPDGHDAAWAADAYRDWEVDYMQTEGVDKGMYELRDVARGKATVGGKLLYTLKYRQTWPDPDGKDMVIHAHLYLFFPDTYNRDQRFYWIHYQHLCEHGEQEQLLLEIVDSLLSALSLDMREAPRQTSVTWSSIDGTYVAINTLGDNRTYYFNNEADRRCFSFSLDGIWATLNAPGYFIGQNGYDMVAVELAGAYELTGYPGNDLVERVVAGKREVLGLDAPGEVRVLANQDAANVFPGARRVAYEVPFEALGLRASTVTTWYIAEIAPGWAALAHASRNMNSGDDDLAREILASIRLTEKPGCFRDEIAELLR